MQLLYLILLGIKFKKNIPNGWSGIRTHEAEAVDLKSTPFDRSGNLTGAPWRARTADLRVISTLLYQLS